MKKICFFFKKHQGFFGGLLSGILLCSVLFGVAVFRLPGSKLVRQEMLIQNRFVGEYDFDKIEDAAASAMVSALGDRWSHYLSKKAYEADINSMKSQYVGIGVTVTLEENGLRVSEVTSGGPAEESGILPKDLIVGAGEMTVEIDGVDAVYDAIAGDAGTQVEIKLMRGEEAISLWTVRRAISVEVARLTMLEDDIALIRINTFHGRCAEETNAAIKEAVGNGAKALIFDVRNNPGGYTDEMVKVLDTLLPEGVVFRTESSAGKKTEEHSDAQCVELPMAVIVNGNSYSAAEFFAAVLQEQGVATVVGEKTCGKGYYQITYPLADGSAVGLSVGKYFTPNGVSLIGIGVSPDVPAEVDEATAEKIMEKTVDPAEDLQILAAINALKSGLHLD